VRVSSHGKNCSTRDYTSPGNAIRTTEIPPSAIREEKNPLSDWFVHPLVADVERGYTFRILVPDIREGSMPKTERDREISRRRQKRKKMEFLRGRLAETKDSKARAVLIQKILKINPQANIPQK
jgi:hypothetical protein